VPNSSPDLAAASNTLGILNPRQGLTHFSLQRFAPAADLAPFVERHWIVRWDLHSEPSFEQEILPHPCVNLAFEPGKSAVHGIGTRRAVAKLQGQGRAIATKFRPGAFVAFTDVAMAALVDMVVPLERLFGPAALSSELAVLAEADDTQAIVRLETFLRGRAPRPDPQIDLVAQLVAAIGERRDLCQADDLVPLADMSLRSLHRLFEHYIGLGPKWVIRRTRAQQAAERVRAGDKVDWASLAYELGYHDQAHLIRDFKAQIGFTPVAYAARCADPQS
jgi:AraC-like DNA-binding protein